MTNKKKRELILAAFAALLAFSTWSCSENDHPSESTSPMVDDIGNPLSRGYVPMADTLLLQVCEREPGEIGKSRARIGPGGGVLTRAEHILTIPAGALTRTVGITFIIPRTEYLECILEPHGLDFELPVSLNFSYDGICWDDDDSGDDDLDEEDFKVAYFNPDTEVWEAIPTTVDTVLNTATGSLEGIVGFTDHFSRYGIIKR